MKIRTQWISLAVITVALSVLQVQAINWDGGGGNNIWSVPENWAGDNTPDNNTESAAFQGGAHVAINVDQNFTIQSYIDGYGGEGYTNTLYGAGTLTIDRNKNGWPAILNATGNGGGTLRLNGGININNSAGGNTLVRNDNSAGNTTLFDTNSKLTLSTVLQTSQGAGGTIQFNGQLLSSSANLVVGSDNVSFGDGHDSSAFGRDIVLNSGAKMAVEGGTVLNSNRKFQINGDGELELNAANAINDANIVVALGNNLLIDANSNQGDMGVLLFDSGTVTLDLAESVSAFAFDDSSAQSWGAGALVISNFTAGVVSFGSDAGGLTAGQLSQVSAYDSGGSLVGGLSLDGAGALIPEPATLGLISLVSVGFMAWRRLMI